MDKASDFYGSGNPKIAGSSPASNNYHFKYFPHGVGGITSGWTGETKIGNLLIRVGHTDGHVGVTGKRARRTWAFRLRWR